MRGCGLTLALIAAGCGGGDRVTPDAGDASAPDAAAPEVSLPSPLDWPCPAGWQRTSDACVPWGPEGPGCPDGEVRFVGAPGCVTAGGDCPTGDFAADPPTAGRVLHVRAGEPPGGDGSLDAPLSTIADALSRSASGDVISLAKGVYDGVVRLPAGVSLVGACAAQTRLTTDRPHDFEGLVTIIGDDASLSRVTLTGARAGVWADTHSVTLRDLVVDGATGFGVIAAFGATVRAERIVVQNTAARDGRFGVGLFASEAGSIDVVGAVIADNLEIGAGVANEGSVLSLRDAWVTRTRPDARGRFGRGVVAQSGGRASLSTSLVEDAAEAGLLVTESSEVIADDLVVRGRAGGTGRGIQVLRGGRGTFTRALVEATTELGVVAAQADTTLSLSDVLIRSTQPAMDGTSGIGLLVEEGAVATLSRVELAANRDTGLLVRGLGTLVMAADLEVTQTESQAYDGSRGVGLEASGGASVTAERAAFTDNRQAGVTAFDEATEVMLLDLSIDETRERACVVDTCGDAGGGVGLVAVRGAEIRITRFSIARSALAGVQLVAGRMSLRDGVIRDNPIGLNLQDTALTLEELTDRVRFIDNERVVDSATLWVPEAGL